jgi:uncharacterized protein (DUF427 family)
MTLTMPPGPLATQPTSATNYRIDGPAHRILFEPHPRRYRAEIAGHAVLDTTGGHLLHESQILPVLYVPLDDFDRALLEPADHATHCPFKGDASYFSVRAGERVVENAIWTYEQPLAEAAWLRGFASLYWDKADAWYEEDERLLGRFRDPYHRVDVRRSSRAARVTAGGALVAETERPLLVFETNLPVRVYVPRDDVVAELRPSERRAVCPYKGEAAYFSVVPAGGELIADAAWHYPRPLPDMGQELADGVAFMADGIEIELADRDRSDPAIAPTGAR